jgi:2-polyprenyl-3-methyl-5-hydroxy-6-metoxy-1,4-benzoquinol methylase
MKRSKLYNPFTQSLYERFLSFFYIPNYLIDSSTRSVLDVGCGNGLQMKLIRCRFPKIEGVGIDIYDGAVKECRTQGTYKKVILEDIRNMSFKDKSFDVVVCFQVIEHLTEKQAIKLLDRMEKIARKQIIISTPFGQSPYHTEDDNMHQTHKSFFYPAFFGKRGYKTIRMGGKIAYGTGEGGLIHKIKIPILHELIFLIEPFLTPYYLLNQSKASYYFFAFKKLS